MSAHLLMQGTLVKLRKVKKVLTLIQVFSIDHIMNIGSISITPSVCFECPYYIRQNSGSKKREDIKADEVEDRPRSFHNPTSRELTARNVSTNLLVALLPCYVFSICLLTKNNIRDVGSTADLVLVLLVHLVHWYLVHLYPMLPDST